MWLLVRGLLLGVAMSTQAQAVTFDFEEFAATRTDGQDALGLLTGLSSTKGDVTMELRVVRQSSAATDALRFDIRQWSSEPMPSGWGLRALDPTFADNPNDTWILATFSRSVTSISVQLTDFGGFADTLELRGYSGANASGELLGSGTRCFGTVAQCPGRVANGPVPGRTPDYDTVSLVVEEAEAIRSVLFRGRDSFNWNGNLVDNITVDASNTPEIPEPSAGLLAGFTIGALAAAAALHRRS